MGVGVFLEPLVVVFLLFAGTVTNRDKFFSLSSRPSNLRCHSRHSRRSHKRSDDPNNEGDVEYGGSSPCSASHIGPAPSSSGLSLSPWDAPSSLNEHGNDRSGQWRTRVLRLWCFERKVRSPDTTVFEDRFLSRLLRKFPFLVEAWYWALIYWVYQLGRAFTAVTMAQDTIDIARKHALQIINLERILDVFVEREIQQWFLGRPTLMHWTNRLYSFVHIPGTIAFLIVLYYLTTTMNRSASARHEGRSPIPASTQPWHRFGPRFYETRRRTMAMCNLIAFVVFTLWPCMPPRLLSDPNYDGPDAEQAKSYGFVDTVHGTEGESSVWTTNRFCNQYAAMPSLHFGYSLLIGLTISTMPLSHNPGTRRVMKVAKRAAITCLGFSYPFIILAAIVSTANHFVLDAVAGAMVCGIAWWGNEFLLNLLWLEDWLLWAVRIHKPDPEETILDERGWAYSAIPNEAL